jgi:putative Ca2+/H+ antiporter (TMEM165/GDT1 family)
MILEGFTAGLLLITVSELGDKTFCIAMLLAMRNSRKLVFIGVVVALAAMTILSVLAGQVVSLLPKRYLTFAEISLFIGFGLKLLYNAYRMPLHSACDEVGEAKEAIAESHEPFTFISNPSFGVISQAFVLTFVAEWGDRTQFATITLAASNSPLGVTLGATLGHALCAALAVLGGRWVAGRLSERVLTAIGGALFILFGGLAAIQNQG